MAQQRKEITKEEISKCLTNLHITTYEAFLLSAYSQNQPLYTAKTYIFQAIQNYLLTKDSVVVNRINNLFASNQDSFYAYYEDEFAGGDLADILFPESFPSVLEKEKTTIDYLQLETALREHAVYPFQKLIDSPPSKENLLSVYRYNIEPESIAYIDLNILLIFMVFDSCFSAISDSLYSYKDNRTSLIKRLLSYFRSYKIDFNHSSWVLNKIEAGESFEIINKKYHKLISDEHAFFQNLIRALSEKENVDYYGVFLFILSEANKGSKYLDALYNNFHSLPPCSLSPYLYGRLFPSFRINSETLLPNCFDKSTLPPSFIMNELYPKTVESWKNNIQEYFGFNHIFQEKQLISFLENISKIDFIHNYLYSINLIESVKSVASKIENHNGELNAKNYYNIIKTQAVIEKRSKKRIDLIEMGKKLLQLAEWENGVMFDEYNYEGNPFLDFTINDTRENCFLRFFKHNVNEIELIVNGFLDHIANYNDKECSGEENLKDARGFNALFESHPDIFEEIIDLLVWEYKENQFFICKDTIDNDKISIVNRKSPMEWEELFILLCGISFGKKSLAKSSNDLQPFACNCDGSEQSFCKKRFMNVIKNNNPIRKTKISFNDMKK